MPNGASGICGGHIGKSIKNLLSIANSIKSKKSDLIKSKKSKSTKFKKSDLAKANFIKVNFSKTDFLSLKAKNIFIHI